jgi:hypothetical protein
MKPPKGWKLFCENYISNNAYWYIPKGLSIKEDNFSLIRSRLRILKKYEGQDWSSCQLDFVNELSSKGLFERKAKRQVKKDKAAIGRVFKVICTTLGLAWVNENEKIALTEIGNHVIKDNSFSILQKQIDRFQFYNPTFHNKEFKIIRVNPVYFLNSLLLNLEDKYLSKEEYILFVAKQQNNNDVEKSVELIENFRRLSKEKKQQLINYLNSVNIQSKNTNRSSIFNTIKLESSYALQFFGCSSFLTYDNALKLNNVSKSKEFVKYFDKNELWIDFDSEKDWMLYYGQNLNISSSEYAKDYYIDISDIEAGLSFISEKNRRGLKVKIDDEKYKSVLIDEKLLEDFLENHLEELENGLKLIKRQKDTRVGRIDLFAMDRNGYCVIIELKKGRTADKVLGQILRYVGFIQENEANCKKVRAIIVGKNIDEKLKYAVKAARISCNLYEFDFSVKFDRISLGQRQQKI